MAAKFIPTTEDTIDYAGRQYTRFAAAEGGFGHRRHSAESVGGLTLKDVLVRLPNILRKVCLLSYCISTSGAHKHLQVRSDCSTRL